MTSSGDCIATQAGVFVIQLIPINTNRMINNDLEYFEDIEIEHDFRTYYANGYIEYATTNCIGGSYEGYAFEIVSERNIIDITFSALWYIDEETGHAMDILNNCEYIEIEWIAEEVIRYEFE